MTWCSGTFAAKLSQELIFYGRSGTLVVRHVGLFSPIWYFPCEAWYLFYECKVKTKWQMVSKISSQHSLKRYLACKVPKQHYCRRKKSTVYLVHIQCVSSFLSIIDQIRCYSAEVGEGPCRSAGSRSR